jgi:hypothetical protein
LAAVSSPGLSILSRIAGFGRNFALCTIHGGLLYYSQKRFWWDPSLSMDTPCHMFHKKTQNAGKKTNKSSLYD